ncbi:bifunctional alpha,alpha-trehalose-phosphate synthase (UDP-forming)/trehalose-phosphatase [Rubritalea tangerina]|uniref:Bifunctional alpha,alpha-trehalose-phosphate synthase (UDP-forming)/trehalose-phosphatase n=1 Tax=Rubritalea tangerina TaxID=430798 RepID=A0ABW4Z7R2_9BACT
MASLILASNRLPIQLLKDGTIKRTTGGLSSALEGAGIGEQYTWVGWGGPCPSAGRSEEDLKTSLRSLGVEPILLSEDEIAGYYDGYANSTLWPLLHYMQERSRFDARWMPFYQQVNEKFATAISEIADEGAQVWIHDYHLMLLPQLLRKKRPDLKIGFFLHTPFPSSEIFRALPERDALLNGLLGCDLIGFHTYSYLRHFISSLIRILGVEADIDGLWHQNRHIQLGVYPIGHNRDGFQKAATTNTFLQQHSAHAKHLGSGKMILSVERLDYTKGVPEKLQAIRTFLESHPEMRGLVHFVLVAVPSRRGVEEYEALTERVQCEVGAINGTFGDVGHSPVQFLHRSFPVEELAALYALADVCMVTPIVDGMNLVAKEFIDCKYPSHRARPGVLILSEFAGAAHEMSHAILVNPHDTAGVAQAIHTALDMDEPQMWKRIHAMQRRLELNDAGAWAKRFLADLSSATSLSHCPQHASAKSLGIDLKSQLDSGKTLALFLDYDGTLREFTQAPEDAIPSPSLLELLHKLSHHPQVQLAIVSGRPKSFLDQHLGHLPLHFVAEHGYYWKTQDMQDWQLLNPHVDTSWKELILPQLEEAVSLTPGSEIEVKHSSIVWHYRQADPEFGLWRAKGLLSELTSTTASHPVSVHHGQKIIEVASQLVNKGVAVERLLKQWQPDIALAAGDDVTDESMFALHSDSSTPLHTIKVGLGDTRANQRCSIKTLRNLLDSLA